MFESQFTPPGSEGAHEKGGVEGEVGRFRRRHLVPVPEVASLAELNDAARGRLLSTISRDGSPGARETVGEALGRERPLLRALPASRCETAEQATPRVDAKALVTVRQNRYSVPVALVGLRVRARIGAREITIATTAARSPATSAWSAGSAPARSSITTSSCSRASPAR